MRIWPLNATKCCKNAGKFFPDVLLEKNFRLGPIKYLKVVGERYKVKAILRYKSIKNKL